MSENAPVDWNNREACSLHLIRWFNGRTCGANKIAEIDESFFVHLKNNSCRILPQQWTFKDICPKNGGCFLIQIQIEMPVINAKNLWACWKYINNLHWLLERVQFKRAWKNRSQSLYCEPQFCWSNNRYSHTKCQINVGFS